MIRKVLAFILTFISGYVLGLLSHRIWDVTIVGGIFFLVGSLFWLFVVLGLAITVYYNMDQETIKKMVEEKKRKNNNGGE
jgi:ABC-type bacteriocin/lantibiotic exporter with double-glycine peptidase domain